MSALPTKSSAGTPIDLTRQNIREQVYALLRERMHGGQIGLEDRLVDYEIADEMNVSRMPVREALLQLKNEGYVEGTTRGFVLRRFSPEDITNMFEIRLLLEPAAAANACEHASAEGLAQMTAAAAAAERAQRKGDVQAYMQANWSFRTAWVEMVPNRHLAQIIARLRDHAQAVRLATLKDKTYRALSLDHTKRILEAFVQRDLDGVRERVAENLRVSAASYDATQKALAPVQAATGAASPRASMRSRKVAR